MFKMFLIQAYTAEISELKGINMNKKCFSDQWFRVIRIGVP